MADGTVLPLRFGATATGEQQVRDALEEDADSYRERLQALAGCAEYLLKGAVRGGVPAPADPGELPRGPEPERGDQAQRRRQRQAAARRTRSPRGPDAQGRCRGGRRRGAASARAGGPRERGPRRGLRQRLLPGAGRPQGRVHRRRAAPRRAVGRGAPAPAARSAAALHLRPGAPGGPRRCDGHRRSIRSKTQAVYPSHPAGPAAVPRGPRPGPLRPPGGPGRPRERPGGVRMRHSGDMDPHRRGRRGPRTSTRARRCS